MDSWHSLGKIYALGHGAIAELLFDEVEVTEKVDASMFGFGVYNGTLKLRSKGQELIPDAHDKMFDKAIITAKELAPLLHDGWMYLGEFFCKPKHNALAYDRVPNKNIILFNIRKGNESYLTYDEMKAEADRLGLEVVPRLYQGKLEDINVFKDMLNNVSVLGGQKIEGVVVKNYQRFTKDGKAMMGKYVSEAFKEVHKGEWRKDNPTKADIIDAIIIAHRTPARWGKAVQHLREKGLITGELKDIGPMINEIKADVLAECTDDIKNTLFSHFQGQILRGVVGGAPEWYKLQLAEKQFENT